MKEKLQEKFSDIFLRIDNHVTEFPGIESSWSSFRDKQFSRDGKTYLYQIEFTLE